MTATTADLIGRTATVRFGSDDTAVTVTAVKRWEKDGMVRDYIEFAQSRFIIGKAFIAVEGKARGEVCLDTVFGKVVAGLDYACNSGAKKAAARELIEQIFA